MPTFKTGPSGTGDGAGGKTVSGPTKPRIIPHPGRGSSGPRNHTPDGQTGLSPKTVKQQGPVGSSTTSVPLDHFKTNPTGKTGNVEKNPKLQGMDG
jgi:hypothetical protein